MKRPLGHRAVVPVRTSSSAQAAMLGVTVRTAVPTVPPADEVRQQSSPSSPARQSTPPEVRHHHAVDT